MELDILRLIGKAKPRIAKARDWMMKGECKRDSPGAVVICEMMNYDGESIEPATGAIY